MGDVILTPQPTLESIECIDHHQPQVITTDKHGTIYEPDPEGNLVPTRKTLRDAHPQQKMSESPQEHHIQEDVRRHQEDALTIDPESFIGVDVYKYFAGNGVDHAIISSTETHSDGKITWTVIYDDGYEQEFDHDDIRDYAIDYIHGQQVIFDTEARSRLRVEPYIEQDNGIEGFDGSYIKTTNNDTFFDICRKMGINKAQWRQYYEWIQQYFNFGHQHDDSKDGLHFKNPWSGKTKATRPSRFDANVQFPVPSGSSWDGMKALHTRKSNTWNPEHTRALQIRAAYMETYDMMMMVY